MINSICLSASDKDSAAAQLFLSVFSCTGGGDCHHFSDKQEPGSSVSTLAESHDLQQDTPESSPEVDGSNWCDEVADQKAGKEEVC